VRRYFRIVYYPPFVFPFFLCAFSFYFFSFLLFFKFRLITMASTIDFTKRLITNDYYSSLHHVICIVIIRGKRCRSVGSIALQLRELSRCIVRKTRNVLTISIIIFLNDLYHIFGYFSIYQRNYIIPHFNIQEVFVR